MADPGPGPTLGDLAAAYAAILSTGVALIQGAGYLLSRPRLSLSLIETYLTTESDADLGPSVVILQVVNKSRRPVAIKEAGVLVGPKHAISFSGDDRLEPLPEGYPLIFQTERDALIGRMIQYGPGTRLAYLYAKDYYGKVHKTKVPVSWREFAGSMVDELGARRNPRPNAAQEPSE
jgi:hypothetical protein